MRALVTGADGFLGANLARLLRSLGVDVIGAALNRHGHTALDALGVDIRLEYGDILDPAYLRRLVNAYEPQWVFHLAAVSIVRVAQADPYRAVHTNVMGTLNVLDACRYASHGACAVQAVVVASSDKAYGDYGGQAYTEDLPLKPSGAYELSKALADTLARGWAQELEARVMVTRCANLYGPGDLQWSRLIPNSCRRIAAGQPPEVHPGAWQFEREWLYVEDAARAYVAIAEKGVTGEAYNVGSGEVATAGTVAARLAWHGQVAQPVESTWTGLHEIPAQKLSCDKVQRLGWRAGVDLSVGLEHTLSWYRGYLEREP